MGEPNVREFFSRVLPWPTEDQGTYKGFVNLHWTIPNKHNEKGKPFWIGKPSQTINGFFNTLTWVRGLKDTRDIYFCTSLQSAATTNKSGKPAAVRNAENAMALKAIWLDLDVVTPGKVKDGKKEYETIEEAAASVIAFCETANLSRPSALVGSGGGLHCYWIATVPLAPDRWSFWAERLATLAKAHGVNADLGCTTDRARILRVPGTFNHKTNPPRPTRLIYLAEKDIDDLR